MYRDEVGMGFPQVRLVYPSAFANKKRRRKLGLENSTQEIDFTNTE